MPTDQQSTQQSIPAIKAPTQLPIGVLLSLSTAPLLCLLLGGRALALALTEIGQTSEELFRGDRLPVLKMTAPDAEQSAL
jgi:hypothetical protein